MRTTPVPQLSGVQNTLCCGRSGPAPSSRHHAQEVTHGMHTQGASRAECCEQSTGSLRVRQTLTAFSPGGRWHLGEPETASAHTCCLRPGQCVLLTSSENFGRSICSRGARRCRAERSWSASEQLQRANSARRQPGRGKRERERESGGERVPVVRCLAPTFAGGRDELSKLSQVCSSTLFSTHMLMKQARADQVGHVFWEQHVVYSSLAAQEDRSLV